METQQINLICEVSFRWGMWRLGERLATQNGNEVFNNLRIGICLHKFGTLLHETCTIGLWEKS